MRIIGEIPHHTMKITVFQHAGKLSAKFETGLIEQTYKWRESDQLKDFADIEKLVTPAFQQAVLDQFTQMGSIKNEAVNEFLKDELIRFPKVI